MPRHQAASSSLLEQKQRCVQAQIECKEKEREISAVATDVAVSVDKPVSPYAVVLDQPNIWTGFGEARLCCARQPSYWRAWPRTAPPQPLDYSRCLAQLLHRLLPCRLRNPIDAKSCSSDCIQHRSNRTAHADVTIKLVGQHGWKAPALRLQNAVEGTNADSMCGYHQDRCERVGMQEAFLFPAGRSTIPLADSDEEEERTARLLEMAAGA